MPLAGSPLVISLLQITLLLALAWGGHAWLRARDPRWRLILWRSVLGISALILLGNALHVPRLIRFSPPRLAAEPASMPVPAIDVSPRPSQAEPTAAPRLPASPSSAAASAAIRLAASKPPAAPQPPNWFVRSWPWWVFATWAAGCIWQVFRLLRQQRQIQAIVAEASPAAAPVQSLARRIQDEMGVRRDVRVLVSEQVGSPFLYGVFRPVILVPPRMTEDIPAAELAALLNHELAHELRHDLAWCLAWRLAQAAGWFHPLVWRIPGAHLLACEEEADRIAAQRSYAEYNYARLLARLALRVLQAPPAATALALHATSHLAHRLRCLGRGPGGLWGRRQGLVASCVGAALFLLTAGWELAQETVAAPREPILTATVPVRVQDESGRSIAGATVIPVGLRAEEERLRGTGYGWVPERHGPALPVVTDQNGEAWLTYPISIVPAEKIRTGRISFTVDHADFAREQVADFAIDGSAPAVRLRRGIPLRVTAWFGAGRQRVGDVVPHLIVDPRGATVRPADWQREAEGSQVYRRLSRGKHFLHLTGRLPSGELVYSDGTAFFGEQREAHDLEVELKPGVRVEGRLDASVPRPIRNGWVQLSVHDDQANTRDLPPGFPRSFGNTGFWFTYRPINPDGTFVFEGVPEGKLKVIAHGDGFISVNGPEPEQATPPGVPPPPPRKPTRSVPQSFAATRPLTAIEVPTERTATVKVRARSDGKPVAGARIHIWPNVAHMPTGSRIFGAPAESSEARFRELVPMPKPEHSVVTDRNGIAVLQNVPAFTSELMVEHGELEAPLRQPERSSMSPARFVGAPNRFVAFELSPGAVAEVEVALQPKGRDYAGVSP